MSSKNIEDMTDEELIETALRDFAWPANELAKRLKESLEREERHKKALRQIAGGLIDGTPGAPDIMSDRYSGSKSINFYGDMWEWSQQVAREALQGAK